MLITALLLAAPLAQERPGSWLERFQLAEARLEAGQLDDAVTALEACLELAPANATTAYHLACAHARGGRLEEAARWLVLAARWGHADPDVTEWDADLAPLRGSERFRQALEAMAAAADGTATDGEVPTIAPFASQPMLAVSPDGDWFVAGDALWHADVPFPIQPFPEHGEGIAQAAWDSTGRWLVTAGRAGELVLRDGATAEALRVLEGRGSWADAPSFSADGGRLTCGVRGPDAGVRVWDLPSGERRGAWFGTACDRARLSASGRYLATLDRDNLWVWDVDAERWIARSKHVRSIRFEGETLAYETEDDGRWRYAADSDELTRLEDRPRTRPGRPAPAPQPLNAVRAYPVRLTPRRVVLTCDDGTLRVVDLRSARVVRTLTFPRRPHLRVGRNGRTVVTELDGDVEIRETSGWTRSASFGMDPDRVLGSVDPTGALLPVHDGEGLTLRRLEDGAIAYSVRVLDEESPSFGRPVWSADGSRMAAVVEVKRLAPEDDDWTATFPWVRHEIVCTFDASDGRELPRVDVEGQVEEIALSPDGALLAVVRGTREGPVLLSVHDIDTGERVGPVTLGDSGPDLYWWNRVDARFDDSGRILLWGHFFHEFLEARDARTLAVLWRLPGDGEELEFGGDGIDVSGHRLLYDDNRFVVDVETGAHEPIPTQDIEDLFFVGEDFMVASRRQPRDGRTSPVVLDAAGRELYALHAYPGPRAIAVLPSGYVAGDVGIGEDLVLRVGGVPSDLEAYAALLYDPKRVAAAAAGVRVQAPRLPLPPELTDFEPGVGLRTVGNPCHLAASATDPSGILGFLLAIDGGSPRFHPGVPSDGASRLELDLPRPPGADETAVVLRAVSREGILGRPAVGRLRWRE